MVKGKNWSVEEDDFLKENVGKKSFQVMSKHLNRTVVAIESRARRLGIDNTKFESGKLTANEMARALNVDNHTVYRWIQTGGLKSVKKATRQSAKFNLISIDDFWKWAKNNKEKLNFYKIEPLVLLPEPDWVEDERKKDYHAIPKRQAAKWTDEEDYRLVSLLKGNYTQTEIGEFLNRSENAIQRRISRLRERGIIPMKKICLRWSQTEVQLFKELDSQGLSDKEIAFELGREREHIVDKRRTMRKYGNYQGRKQKVSS